MSRGYSSSDRSVNDLRPPPGIPLCGGRLRAYPQPPRPDPKPSRADRLADALFCTECLRLRVSPGHWLMRWAHSGR